jgi:hypothetical protein
VVRHRDPVAHDRLKAGLFGRVLAHVLVGKVDQPFPEYAPGNEEIM